jgi:hypothetical protein
MKVRVIILAQGTQQRFTGLKIPKQLLELDGLGTKTILDRTLFQLCFMPGEVHCTVVCDGALRAHVEPLCRDGRMSAEAPGHLKLTNLASTATLIAMDVHTLPDPGNSSLKGLQRFLRDDTASLSADAIVVLLGDVVYSWSALRALWQCPTPLAFACTPNISPGAGELFGIVATSPGQLMAAVDVAMERHSPKQVDKTYQPGMLRLVLFAIDKMHQWMGDSPTALGDHALADRPWFISIDDFSRDFDKPSDLEQMPATARAAREDDARSGFTW